jgi:hypothetical protein
MSARSLAFARLTRSRREPVRVTRLLADARTRAAAMARAINDIFDLNDLTDRRP